MIKPSTPEAYSLFHDGLLTLAEMERNGLRIDTDYLDRKIEETKLQIRELEENLKKDKVYRKWVRKFRDKTNLGSRDQLSQLVFTELGYAPKGLTSTGRIRADKDALDGIDLPFVRDYLTVEKLKKMLSTNLIGIKREVCDGFLHPFFNANTVSTFRLSSSLPNSQNIPIRDKLVGPTVRGMFIPREGCATVEIDYGALEFKGAANFWKDPNMVDYADNHDVHRTCAAKLFLCEPDQVTKDARYLAKNRFVFPILYGSYYRKCAMNLWRGVQDMGITLVDGMPMFDHLKKQGVKKLGLCDTKERPVKGTFEHKTQEAENWFNGMFPKFMNGKDPWWNEYCRNGYFQMQTGFVCSGVFSRNFLLNAPIQGSGSHLLLWSANQLRKHIRKYKRKWYPSGCIHDCLLTDMPPKDVPEYLEVAEDIMTRKVRKHWDWILTRLEVEADVVMPGENWSQKKPWTKKDGVWKPKENKK